jgi:hypothetical protein
MIDFCPSCSSNNYHAVNGCNDCGFVLTLSLLSPSLYQEDKFMRHGIDVTPSGIQAATASWNPFASPNQSHFATGIDLARGIEYVAASGSILQPNSRFPHRGESVVWYFGRTTGDGVFRGAPQYFYGIRAVFIDDPTKLHFFPDNIRPDVDLSVKCRVCQTVYPATAVPMQCICGHPLTHSTVTL